MLRERLLASTVMAGLAMIAAPAVAQEAAAASDPTQANTASVPAEATEAGDDAIIVTGSRIARPDLEASSPVAVISGDALKVTNTVTVEQILTANPQFAAGFGSSSNNPGDGASTVNLRALEEKRTLVLIDGKRAPFYDTDGAVDVSTIPTALIKRVDVLTGGASTVYGSDAIAGVVNFVLDDRFEGFLAEGSQQISSRGDGRLSNASLTAGFKLGDRGHFIVSGGYAKRKAVFFGARARNAVALDSEDLVSSGGSSNTIPTAFDVPTAGRLQIRDDGTLSNNVLLYNFNPVNYAQLPFERYSAVGLLRYELTDDVEVYGRASYSKVKVDTNLAATATAGFPFNLDPSNPFLSPAQRTAFFNTALNPDLQINDGSGVADDPTARAGTSVIGIRRRIVETGGRRSTYDTDNYQFLGGLRGGIGESLSWDVSAQYGESKKHTLLRNDLSYTALQRALDVVAGPGGVAQCFDPSGGCVPLNLFSTAPLSQAALAYVLRNAQEDTKTTQFIVSGNLSGDLGFIQLPWADNPAAFSIGAEYRREKGTTLVDANYASGDLIFYGQGQNIVGKYNTKEVYTEVKIPIAQDRPGFYALNLEGGFRYSDYSTVGSVYTYKAGGDYSPVQGVRFRGIYQRAVRAPNIYELFSPLVAGTGSLQVDPCSGTVTAAVRAICVAQGAPTTAFVANGANFTSSVPEPVSGQINIFTGGNPNLTEEKADTYTLGLVINPASMRNLSFSVDYYNISIKDAISDTSPFVTIGNCFASGSAASAACAGIVRNGVDGSLSGPTQVGVPAALGNVSSIKTDGIDVTASWTGGDKEGFNYGLSYAGNYILSYKQDGNECAGFFGGLCNLEPMPEYKHVADVRLGYGSISFLTRWRYLGSVKQDSATNILNSKISGYSYIDQTVSFDVDDRLTFRVGVLNAFDVKPPLVGDTTGADAGGGSTYPNTYDVIGRQFFAGASVKF